MGKFTVILSDEPDTSWILCFGADTQNRQNQNSPVVPTLMPYPPCKKINSYIFELSHANRLLLSGVPNLLPNTCSWCKA